MQTRCGIFKNKPVENKANDECGKNEWKMKDDEEAEKQIRSERATKMIET